MATQVGAAGPAHPAPGAIQNPYSLRPSWLYPSMVVFWFSLFILYATVVVIFGHTGRFGGYLSPFFSPEVNLRVGGFLIPPAIWVAWAPLAFRLTCYYYRKAYFRGFFGRPRSCAVPATRPGRYSGEKGFFIYNNLHRFAFYAIVIQTLFLYYDAIVAFTPSGWGYWHFGIGNLIMVVNVVCLSGYTYGCHAFRNLVGGGADCFSCHRTRFTLWKGVTVLNINHEAWAWVSMFTVWFTDLYIRLALHGYLGFLGGAI